jgi:transcriptional antiterminator RfaH
MTTADCSAAFDASLGRERAPWYLVFTKAQGEQTACINLDRQGYRVYCPRLLRRTVSRGRWIERIVALFPRYLFVQLDATARQSLAPVRSTIGVAGIVRFGSEPAVIPQSMVDALKGRADPATGLHRLAEVAPLERGSPVKVIAGAFQGFDGIFERAAGEDRVVVLLKLLGESTPVQLESYAVVSSVL